MPGLIRTISRPFHRLLWLIALMAAASVHADELAEVQRLYYAGQADAAMRRADDYLAAHPKDAPMRFVKGVMLADAKRSTEAIALYQQLSTDYPDLAEPYNNLAVLYAAGGDYAKARATLELALNANPSYATAYENLGDVYAALAAQAYNRVLKFEPANTTAASKLTIVRELYKQSRASAPAALATHPKTGDSP